MNCQEFHDHWNMRLDSGRGLESEVFPDAHAHENQCDECRRLANGYRALSRLLPLAPPSDLPASGLADRVLDQLAATRKPGRMVSRAMFRQVLSIAAVLVLSVTVGLLVHRSRSSSTTALTSRPSVVPARPSLSLALAEASKATLALARETSGPAARVGNDLLGGSDRDDAPRLTFSMPFDVADKVDSSSEALINVGRRVNHGVRPLSGTARAAFGFLLRTSGEARPKIGRRGSGA